MTQIDTSAPEGVAITIDGREIIARPGELLIDAAERHGTFIPRFCYHPRMTAVGMCRMCLVECDTGRGMGLQPACMVPVSDDMAVVTDSEVVKKAQDGVLEFLLINHPLDCPICDKGGECPLQDQTMAYGPGESRFVEIKRTFEKPIPISDTVYLDRERCILCDRCTRFAAEVAGDPLIHFQDRGNATQVNTFPDHPFASYYSGNVVQICPVGALTAKPYRFKARPWDLEEIASTLMTSPTGDGGTIQSTRDEVLRYMGVDVDAVNWGWLCDKDRFGFEAIKHEHRVVDPLVRGDGLGKVRAGGDELVKGSWATAMKQVTAAMSVNPERMAVIGGARLTNESAYAWARLVKGALGCANTDAQLGDGLTPELLAGVPRATIDEVCTPGGTILYVGPDPKELSGSLFLRLRHAVVHDGARLIEVTQRATGLSELAAASFQVRPGETASTVAMLLGSDDPGERLDAETVATARGLLADSSRMVAGRPSLADDVAGITAAVAAYVTAADEPAVLPVHRRGNTQGALDMGLAPGFLPGRVTHAAGTEWFGEAWGTDLSGLGPGLDTEGILRAAADGQIDTLVLLGADPVADFADRELATRALDGVTHLIALDQFLTESSGRADIVLPVAGMAEVDGTFTNIEGRVSSVRRKVSAPGTARDDWAIASAIGTALGHDLGFSDAAALTDEIAARVPSHQHLTAAVLGAANEGVVVGRQEDAEAPSVDGPGAARPTPVAWDPTAHPVPPAEVDAGGDQLRLVVTPTLYDAGTLIQHCPSSAQLARTPTAAVHPRTATALGIEAGAEVVVRGREEISLELVLDEGVAPGVVGLHANLTGAEPNRLIDASASLTSVRVGTR